MSRPEAEHDLDDGATEVVDQRPMRRARAPADLAKVASAAPGGRMAALHAAGMRQRRDFIILRRQGQPACRISLAHEAFFKTVWSLWTERRTAGEDDPGVTTADVQERHAEVATSSISAALRSMVRNGALRATDQQVGWRSQRTRYYPTETGVAAFALAEYLGEGSFVQVGRTTKSWRSRNEGEPGNLFQHAKLLRGGAEPAESVSVESA
jgi:DNA-binding PadR family transcriptional regulator